MQAQRRTLLHTIFTPSLEDHSSMKPIMTCMLCGRSSGNERADGCLAEQPFRLRQQRPPQIGQAPDASVSRVPYLRLIVDRQHDLGNTSCLESL